MTPPSEALAGQAIEAARQIEAEFDGRTRQVLNISDVRLVARAYLSLHAQNERMRKTLREVEPFLTGLPYPKRDQLHALVVSTLKDQP